MTAVTDCFLCKQCDGAAYEWNPILYTGNLNSDILIIAQNPGSFSIKGTYFDEGRFAKQLEVANQMKKIEYDIYHDPYKGLDEDWLLRQYAWDFGDSYGAKQLSLIFGEGWLNHCCYTNAVLCRTPKNKEPSEQMQKNCREWTLDLIEMHPRKLIVPIGRVAANQVIPRKQIHWGYGIDWGTPRELKSGRYLLPFVHYSAWKYTPEGIAGTIKRYAETFKATVTALRISYLFD